MRAQDEVWAVWFRNGFDVDGRWYCWTGTAHNTRRDAIRGAITDGYGAMKNANDWRNLRRRGVVACRRTTLTAPSFGDPRFP